jgi:plastocyanin
MTAALLVLAAGEPSKVPFYVVGGCLALWAVVLSLIGLSRPGFPAAALPQRAVMLVSALLVAGTVGAAIATASKPKAEAGAEQGSETPAKGQAAPVGGTVKVSADPSGALKYDTKSLQAKTGKVTIDFDNPAPLPHNVTVEGAGKKIGGTNTLANGKATAKLDLKPGTYTFYCSVDAHRQGGMEGQLVVSS